MPPAAAAVGAGWAWLSPATLLLFVRWLVYLIASHVAAARAGVCLAADDNGVDANAAAAVLPDQAAVLVTGAARGIGRELAVVLRERGWRLVLARRPHGDKQDGDDVQDSGTVWVEGDLQDPDQAAAVGRAAVAACAKRGWKLKALVNNAAVMPAESCTGEDIAFAVNVRGTYAVTRAVLPTLLSSASTSSPATVVTLSSFTHRAVHGGNTVMPAGPLLPPAGPAQAYQHSKLCCAVLSRELHRHFHHKHLITIAYDPGAVETALVRQWPKPLALFYYASMRVLRLLRPAHEPALALARMLMRPDISALASGGYTFGRRAALIRPSALVLEDSRFATALWDHLEATAGAMQGS
eukprot:jgi/Chlat1/242/Chrsp1S03049